MKPEEIPTLLKRISYADPRVLPDDPDERRGKVAMWAGVLRDVPADFALHAAQDHYARSPYPVVPSDIAQRWRRLTGDRLGRHAGTFEPTAHPGLDPDDHAGYLAALRRERETVRRGGTEPRAWPALVATPSKSGGPNAEFLRAREELRRRRAARKSEAA
ncbi:hypothetical protein ACF1DY_01810 [Streptomyces albus]